MSDTYLRKHTYYSYFSILVLVISAAWIWFSRLPEGTSASGLPSAPARGFPAPDFTLTDQENQTIQLSTLKGKPILLNFWASWCPPCRAEMPALQKVYDQYRDQGVTILAVNSTIQDDIDQATTLMQELEITFPVLWDTDGSVTQAYQVRSLPTSFFIDSKGIVQEVVIGGPISEALLISRVQLLLPEPNLNTR